MKQMIVLFLGLLGIHVGEDVAIAAAARYTEAPDWLLFLVIVVVAAGTAIFVRARTRNG